MKLITVKHFTLCFFLVISCLIARAQVISCYFPEDFVVDAGSDFTADLQIDSFINVGGCGFSINWDPAVLRFKEVSNLGLTLSELSGFNDNGAVSDGELGFFWISSSATQGVTLADSSLLMSLTFEVIGNAGDTTSLRFTDEPAPIEFVSPDLQVIPANFSAALVTVTGTSNASYNSAPEIITLHPPVPNPFHENTQISLDLRKASRTTIKVIDQQGKVLHDEELYLGPGIQNIPLTKEIFKQSGTYYCLLNASDFRIMQKLVFIDR